MQCQIYNAMKRIKDNQDQKCVDIITNVINGASRAASAPIDRIDNKAKVVTEFIVNNGKVSPIKPKQGQQSKTASVPFQNQTENKALVIAKFISSVSFEQLKKYKVKKKSLPHISGLS